MSTMFFLIMIMSGTERPTMVLMHSFETAADCNKQLAKAPADIAPRFACIGVDFQPEDVLKRNKI